MFALDCEMCYTAHGLEVCRVSVVDDCGNVALDELVKPSGYVLDYNTQYSGIAEADLQDVKTTLSDVFDHLSRWMSSKSIIVGHSLESDLKALRVSSSCQERVAQSCLTVHY